MAKRKKAKRSPVRRRRRIGAMSLNVNSPLVKYGPIVGGFFLGDTINDKIDTAVPDTKMSQTVKGVIEGGIGAALVFAKLGKKKTPVEMIAGGVMAGAGLRRLLKEFGVIQGIGGYSSVPVVAARHHRHRLNGYGSVPVIGNGQQGYNTNRGLNGALNGVPGYAVPAPPSSVMAGIGASSVGSGGSECMQ